MILILIFENIQPKNILSKHSKELCEGEISIEECKRIVFDMKSNKSPGLDDPLNGTKHFGSTCI